MKKFLHKGQKGFTLIELLIVIAILGILIAVAVPNVVGFITSGKIAAANSEVANVMTANMGYAAEHNGLYATASSSLAPYISGGIANLKASYTFDANTGAILTADTTIAGGYGTVIDFKLSTQQWQRGTTGKNIP